MASWLIRDIDQVPAVDVERASGATIQVLLGPDQGMPRFYTRRFTLEPGGRIPAHRHATIEHEQVMLEGEMEITFDGQTQRVRAGQCIYIPAGVGHAYENRGAVRARFLCVVPASARYETEWLE